MYIGHTTVIYLTCINSNAGVYLLPSRCSTAFWEIVWESLMVHSFPRTLSTKSQTCNSETSVITNWQWASRHFWTCSGNTLEAILPHLKKSMIKWTSCFCFWFFLCSWPRIYYFSTKNHIEIARSNLTSCVMHMWYCFWKNFVSRICWDALF